MTINIGGTHNFDFGRMRLNLAQHGNSAPDGTVLGPACGFVVEIDGATAYHPGDTRLTMDMRLLAEVEEIDVALMSIGDNFTMGIPDVIRAVEFVQPRMPMPIRYNTFEIMEADPIGSVRICPF